jgi:class 3 adenylate cyclase
MDSAALPLKELLHKGLIFEAFDKIRQALDQGTPQDPDYFSLTAYQALAFLKTGSLEEASQTLAPFLKRIEIQGKPFLEALPSLTEEKLLSHFHTPATRTLVQLPSPFSLSLPEMSQILYELWREGWEEEIRLEKPSSSLNPTLYLHLARLFMLQEHLQKPCSLTSSRIALYSWILGEDKLAQAAASQVPSFLSLSPSYTERENGCYAALIAQHPEEALDHLKQTLKIPHVHFHEKVHTRHQLLLLERIGLQLPVGLLELVPAPKVVVFTGHPLDHHEQTPPCFPARAESIVHQEIERQLDQLQGQVGYCMGAAGSELIFAETLLEKGGEVNLVLPCDLEDFIRTSVSYAGPRWETRFRHILEKASSITYATQQPLLGQHLLYQFANQVLHGVAEMRAQYFGTRPHLLALWDHKSGSLPGGAGDFIDRWDSIETLHIVDLEELLRDHLPPVKKTFSAPSSPPSSLSQKDSGKGPIERHIKTLLFSDLAGYSRLQDDQMADFLQMMEDVAQDLKKKGLNLGPLNTWGDALFMVMDQAVEMALFAVGLCKAIEEHGANPHFSRPLVARISLHAGPIFSTMDAFTGRENYFGSHINRAARLEPVTMAGQVFATQQFVALLQAELGVLKSEGRLTGPAQRLRARYVGIIELAKNFGTQSIYQILL